MKEKEKKIQKDEEEEEEEGRRRRRRRRSDRQEGDGGYETTRQALMSCFEFVSIHFSPFSLFRIKPACPWRLGVEFTAFRAHLRDWDGRRAYVPEVEIIFVEKPFCPRLE